MNRKIHCCLGLILTLVLSFHFLVPEAGAAKEYRAERYDVQIEIQPGGDLLITETIVFRFEGGPFTYVFREIPFNRVDEILFQHAAIDGRILPQGTSAGHVEIETLEPLKVVWHFSPASDMARTFTLVYRVRGAVRKGAEDSIHWYAVPEEHGYAIDQATVMLSVPPSTKPLEPPSLDRTYTGAMEDGRYVLRTGALSEDDGLILSVRFPADSLGSAAPLWQIEEQEKWHAFSSSVIPSLLIAAITAGLGLLGLGVLSRRFQRDLMPPPTYTGDALPADLPPALVGRMTGSGLSFVGTFLDLARRGVLLFEEGQGGRGKTSYVLRRLPGETRLLPHEELILNALFPEGTHEIGLKEAVIPLTTLTPSFNKRLDEELISRGWLDPERKRIKTILEIFFPLLMMAGIAALTAAVTLGLVLQHAAAWIAPLTLASGFCAAVALVGIAGTVYATRFSPLTPQGEGQAALWKGFRAHLQQISRGEEIPMRPDFFELHFPYAAVFNLGSAWMKNLERQGMLPSLAWVRGLSGDAGDFRAFFDAAMVVNSGSDGSGGDGGGGGGASGGGSSGAG